MRQHLILVKRGESQKCLLEGIFWVCRHSKYLAVLVMSYTAEECSCIGVTLKVCGLSLYTSRLGCGLLH
jgi:hypothetical protein